MPWSFYAVIISFGVFFASLNIYIISELICHPIPNEPWLFGIVGGFIALLYSIHMVRVHQRELIERKRQRDLEALEKMHETIKRERISKTNKK